MPYCHARRHRTCVVVPCYCHLRRRGSGFYSRPPYSRDTSVYDRIVHSVTRGPSHSADGIRCVSVIQLRGLRVAFNFLQAALKTRRHLGWRYRLATPRTVREPEIEPTPAPLHRIRGSPYSVNPDRHRP